MYCRNCGELIETGEMYCTHCGTRVSDENGFGKKVDNGKNYGLKDMLNENVPGARWALFGIVITLLSATAGEIGMFTSFIAIILLVIARVIGFRSIWIWVGTVACCIIFMSAASEYVYKSSMQSSLFIGNLFGFFSLFF